MPGFENGSTKIISCHPSSTSFKNNLLYNKISKLYWTRYFCFFNTCPLCTQPENVMEWEEKEFTKINKTLNPYFHTSATETLFINSFAANKSNRKKNEEYLNLGGKITQG